MQDAEDVSTRFDNPASAPSLEYRQAGWRQAAASPQARLGNPREVQVDSSIRFRSRFRLRG
jgi:hypothetical protein